MTDELPILTSASHQKRRRRTLIFVLSHLWWRPFPVPVYDARRSVPVFPVLRHLQLPLLHPSIQQQHEQALLPLPLLLFPFSFFRCFFHLLAPIPQCAMRHAPFPLSFPRAHNQIHRPQRITHLPHPPTQPRIPRLFIVHGHSKKVKKWGKSNFTKRLPCCPFRLPPSSQCPAVQPAAEFSKNILHPTTIPFPLPPSSILLPFPSLSTPNPPSFSPPFSFLLPNSQNSAAHYRPAAGDSLPLFCHFLGFLSPNGTKSMASTLLSDIFQRIMPIKNIYFSFRLGEF